MGWTLLPYLGDKLGDVGPHKNCRNVPVPPGTTWDKSYREMFTAHALPFLNDPSWGRPDLVASSLFAILYTEVALLCHTSLRMLLFRTLEYLILLKKKCRGNNSVFD